jgi:hypothetical protein
MQSQKLSASTSRQKQYARLGAQLAQIGWISEGYVQDRGPGAGGACYPWTRKVKGKTVCVALSKEGATHGFRGSGLRWMGSR